MKSSATFSVASTIFGKSELSILSTCHIAFLELIAEFALEVYENQFHAKCFRVYFSIVMNFDETKLDWSGFTDREWAEVTRNSKQT